ncbi:hypothetical protein AB0L57_15490 [Nocardia sp. NPDC052254]|uniref:hypothetical protein n=1 Tax=Nocardia sp. NPDC052254 TaxID=3155681 RepID=UPI0034212DB1
MVTLLVGIGVVALTVISMYAAVVAVWSVKLRGRYAIGVPGAPRESSRLRQAAKDVVSQPFRPERAAADAMP